MQDTLSYRFILELGGGRDGLYGQALAVGGTPVKAEGLLQKSVRAAYLEYEQAQAKRASVDVAVEVAKGIGEAPTTSTENVSEPPVMPADVWARLAAAVQIEAARSSHSAAINPDSVLLSPDPLLAPKKSGGDDSDGNDLSPSSKFVVAVGLAVLIGVALTVYIVTRPSAKDFLKSATTRFATSKPAEGESEPSGPQQKLTTETQPLEGATR